MLMTQLLQLPSCTLCMVDALRVVAMVKRHDKAVADARQVHELFSQCEQQASDMAHMSKRRDPAIWNAVH